MPPHGRPRQLAILLALATLACRPASTPTATPETAAHHHPAPTDDDLDSAITRLTEPESRATALAELDRFALAAKTDDQRVALATVIVPSFLAIWDEARPHRLTMLRVSSSLAHPAVAPLWSRAIGLDGSPSSRDATMLALDGVIQTHATACTGAVIDALEHVLAHPEHDGGESDGEVRALLVQTLEELGEPESVPVLRAVLEQPIERQPATVHRAAASALGRLRAAETVDALLMATFRVPDTPTTRNISERAKTALGAIGEPAVAPTVRMLEGKHAGIQELTALHGLAPEVIEMVAASYLGTIGSPTAVDPLLARLPRAGCRGDGRRAKGGAEGELELSRIILRATIARALGLIGDARAVRPLCDCSTASANPTDMFAIAEALGRIGGPEATACLARVVSKATYAEDLVADRSFVHELQWEAVRFLILAAGPDDVAVIDERLSSPKRPPNVAREQAQWSPGLEVLRQCGSELPCLLEVLRDASAPWFAREVAATHAARLAPEDETVALAIAKAYSVTNPDARVTMAWLVGHMMNRRRCQACADALQRTLDHDRDAQLPAEYQLSVLTVRYAIARVRE